MSSFLYRSTPLTQFSTSWILAYTQTLAASLKGIACQSSDQQDFYRGGETSLRNSLPRYGKELSLLSLEMQTPQTKIGHSEDNIAQHSL